MIPQTRATSARRGSRILRLGAGLVLAFLPVVSVKAEDTRAFSGPTTALRPPSVFFPSMPLYADPDPAARILLEAGAGVAAGFVGAGLGVAAGTLVCREPGDCMNAVGIGGGLGGFIGTASGVYGAGRWAGADGGLGWTCLGEVAGLALGIPAAIWADRNEATQGAVVPLLVGAFLVTGTVTGFELSATATSTRMPMASVTPPPPSSPAPSPPVMSLTGPTATIQTLPSTLAPPRPATPSTTTATAPPTRTPW